MIRLAPDRLAYPARASARLLAPDRGGGAMGTGRPHRIQIVEDDYFIGMQIEDALAAAGYEIVGIAPDRREAIALAGRTTPDLVLMDIRLARGSDGVETAIELRRRYGLRCVFVTAHADAGTRARADPAQPLGWVTKPFTPATLVGIVKATLAADDGGEDVT
ncbi:MAG: response regulator [Rhodovulum sp.]|nr:response regulator [Rhodovulum sp.]